MKLISVYVIGLSILVIALAANIIAMKLNLMTWYGFVDKLANTGLKTLAWQDAVFLFIAYPILLGLPAYLLKDFLK